MTDATIRAATRDDLAEMLALYRHLHASDAPFDTTVAERVWSELLTSGLTTVIVAEAATGLVASCTLAIVPNLTRGGRPYGVIENVVTNSDHRQQGLGQRVLAHALDLAWAADCYKVSLASGRTEEATLRFYETAGFERDAKTYFEIRRR
jgi:ribosomal protein S18 acetylase RimI-like enzyme